MDSENSLFDLSLDWKKISGNLNHLHTDLPSSLYHGAFVNEQENKNPKSYSNLHHDHKYVSHKKKSSQYSTRLVSSANVRNFKDSLFDAQTKLNEMSSIHPQQFTSFQPSKKSFPPTSNDLLKEEPQLIPLESSLDVTDPQIKNLLFSIEEALGPSFLNHQYSSKTDSFQSVNSASHLNEKSSSSRNTDHKNHPFQIPKVYEPSIFQELTSMNPNGIILSPQNPNSKQHQSSNPFLKSYPSTEISNISNHLWKKTTLSTINEKSTEIIVNNNNQMNSFSDEFSICHPSSFPYENFSIDSLNYLKKYNLIPSASKHNR